MFRQKEKKCCSIIVSNWLALWQRRRSANNKSAKKKAASVIARRSNSWWLNKPAGRVIQICRWESWAWIKKKRETDCCNNFKDCHSSCKWPSTANGWGWERGGRWTVEPWELEEWARSGALFTSSEKLILSSEEPDLWLHSCSHTHLLIGKRRIYSALNDCMHKISLSSSPWDED